MKQYNKLTQAQKIIRTTKHNDKTRNMSNDLDIVFVENAIKDGCCWCGERNISLTLDRLNNSIGHLKSNCVCACIRCNLFRTNIPIEAWQELAKAMRDTREKGLFGGWTGKIKKSNQKKP